MKTQTFIASATCPKTMATRLAVTCAKRLLLLLLLLFTLPGAVQAQFTFTANNGTITGYAGSGGAVTIPSTINGVLVTAIGDYAFYGCTNLAKVRIPNGVTGIGDYAFESCTSLAGVTIANSVTSIGKGAFHGCTSLTGITIGASVTNIGSGAFSGCANLTNVKIPNSVASIGDYTFQYCSSLARVTIPNSVTGIGEGVFDACAGLTSVTIGNSVTNIGSWAFYGCTNLTKVSIPSGVIGIGDYAFESCTNLAGITIANSVASIGKGAFSGCTSLPSITIGASVTNIGSGAFSGCASLTNVTIPNSVTSIGDYTFQYCSSLTSVAIPNSVTSIAEGVFYGCAGLTSIMISNSVTSIGGDAFGACTHLTAAHFQGNAPGADSSVFSGDTNATVYYSAGTTGWGSTFGGRPVVLWNPPIITVNGKGMLLPNPLSTPLQLGKPYTVTAKPSAGYVFAGWTGGIVSKNSTLSFTAQPNTVLQANFILNPFSAGAGAYAGLFYATNGVTATNSGLFTAQVTSGGALSGKLQFSGGRDQFSGPLFADGSYSNAIPRGGLAPLIVELQVDLTGADTISGTISNADWVAAVEAHRSIYNGTSNPAPQTGRKYTLVIPGSANSADFPGGDGVAALSVNAAGSVAVNGSLGDGAALTAAALVSKTGQWPPYASLYSGKGQVIGWLTLTNDEASPSDLEGVVSWIRPPDSRSALYPAGFGLDNNAFGSVYSNATGAALMPWTNGVLVLEGGDLAGSFTNGLSLSAIGNGTGTNKLRVKVTASSGLFTGSIANPASPGKSIPFKGALMQKQSAGYGYFIGTDQSGCARLIGQGH